MRKYDTYAHMLEFARLRAVEAASESVLDDDVRRIAMDAALADVQCAIRHLRLAQSGMENCVQRALVALKRAESNLTTTSAIPSEPVSSPAS